MRKGSGLLVSHSLHFISVKGYGKDGHFVSRLASLSGVHSLGHRTPVGMTTAMGYIHPLRSFHIYDVGL